MALKHDWYVIVKIRDQENMGRTSETLEKCAVEAAVSLDPNLFKSTQVVLDDGHGHFVRPSWSIEYEVTS